MSPKDPAMDRHVRGRQGFTLVEVLISFAIAATMFAAMFMSLDQIISARQDLANAATPYVIGPAILDAMGQDLANAYFYDLRDNNCFYATDAELNGQPADALSFVTARRTYQPEEFQGDEDRRHSYLNEVSYVLRRGGAGSPFLELWRREDYFVDDAPHADGDYVLVYDRVHSLDLFFVSRNPARAEGVAGSEEKSPEEMLQEGWNSVRESGVPRAVQVVLTIYAQDSDATVESQVQADEARLYTFKRFIALPQIHMSLDVEQRIANWDGTLTPPSTAVVANNRGGDGGAPPVGGGGGGRDGGGTDRPGGQNQPPGNRPGGPAPRPNQGGPGAANPFLDALRNAGRGGASSSGAGGITTLLGGGR